MKGRFKLIFSDQFVRICLLLCLVFIIPLIIVIIVSYGTLPPYIPFFNSMPWGEERLVDASFTALMPMIISTVFLLNLGIAVAVYRKFTLISRIIVFNSFLFLMLGLLAYLQILFLTY